ncbi:MAG TPA: porin family protein [Hymenobacter sp.]|uniref:porin family protein n=1 Tax=Hymenobacter sp. TaxID=1898978 RepID=UPI002D803C8E|nr:porin family protein [Hymenobacter sp.]HET9504231.1 porin family protein [Hymenobacter sp.]
MKKFFLSLGLLAGISTAAQAQSTKFGIKAGASLTNFAGGGASGQGLFGFNGGAFANFALSDAISIQPEVLYSMKGFRREASDNFYGTTFNVKATSRLHNIDVPVLARVTANGLFMEFGPQLGFNIAAKSKSEVTQGSRTTTSKDDFKNEINTVELGFATGVGYQLTNGAGIGLRYNGGLTNISKNNRTSSAVRNSAFQLYLSFLFGGK